MNIIMMMVKRERGKHQKQSPQASRSILYKWGTHRGDAFNTGFNLKGRKGYIQVELLQNFAQCFKFVRFKKIRVDFI